MYLAYGRYQQAEDLIKNALEKEPAREDLNLKLLEVFMAGKNQTAFDEHAQDILARLENSDDPVWEKVAEMGREVSPENPMYQAADQASAPQQEDAELESLADDDMDFRMDQELDTTEPSAESGSVDEGLDFDIDLSPEATEEFNEEQPDSVEFTPPEETAELGEVSEPGLDMEMDSVEPEAIDKGNELDFDLEGLDLGDEPEAGQEPEGDGELADLDEVSTKLDLARAYIDMGDPDGAKSILDEVMEEGSDNQKDEARGIMEKMAS